MTSRPRFQLNPVNVRVVSAEDANRPGSVSADVVHQNPDFCAFAGRMRDTGRIFVVNRGAAAEPVEYDAEQPLDGEANTKWRDCCLWDYLDRKRRFESRFRSRTDLVLRVLGILTVVLAVLYVVWPIWEVFIDVEAESFYRTLEISSKASPGEIKKAYREQMKRWHPDRNPECGERCRNQAMKIQHAHDVLLQRGDQRLALANKYRDELLQLRSIVFFRVYSMAFSSAQALFYILKKIIHKPLTSDAEFGLGAMCKIGTLIFFTAYEVMYVSGFNLFMVVQVFYYCATVARASAQEKVLDAARKASYVDLTREALALLPALTALCVVRQVLSGDSTDFLENAFQACFGSLYVLSFLYNFTPNIYDNFLMRKCSLPIRYISPATLRFSWSAFAASELGFLVDDLFVFTCRVPTVYRLAVYAVHVTFLCQMCLLPWDAPVRSQQNAGVVSPPTQTAAQRSTATTTQPSQEADRTQSDGRVETIVARGANALEIEMLSGLDTEPTPWMAAITIKYKRLLEALARDYTRRFGRKPDAVDLASCTDLEHVTVFALFREQDGSGEEKQKLNQLCRVKDPRFSQWLAIERGSGLMLPANPAEVKTRSIQSIYKEKLGPLAFVTLSDVWRARINTAWPTEAGAATRQMARLIAFLVILVCCLLVLAFPLPLFTMLAATREMAKTSRPLILFRFAGEAATHILNRMGAGLLTALNGRLVVLTPDYLDSARHLRAYNFTGA